MWKNSAWELGKLLPLREDSTDHFSEWAENNFKSMKDRSSVINPILWMQISPRFNPQHFQVKVLKWKVWWMVLSRGLGRLLPISVDSTGQGGPIVNKRQFHITLSILWPQGHWNQQPGKVCPLKLVKAIAKLSAWSCNTMLIGSKLPTSMLWYIH